MAGRKKKEFDVSCWTKDTDLYLTHFNPIFILKQGHQNGNLMSNILAHIRGIEREKGGEKG